MGEDYHFYILEASKLSQDIEYPFLYRLLPGELKKKKVKALIRKKLPVKKEEVLAFGIAGQKITLPFTYQELEEIDQEEVSNIFLRIIEREGAKNMVVNKRFRKFLQNSLLQEAWLLPILYMEETLQWIMRQHSILKKDARIILIDESGSGHTPYVLEQLGEELNFLTIVTKRPEYFIDYVDYMYAQTGLIVTLVEEPVEGILDGNIILDLSSGCHIEHSSYPESCIVFQAFYKYGEIRDFIAKRKDITCYNYVTLKDGLVQVDPQLLMACIREGNGNPNPVQLKLMKDRIKVWNIQLERLGIRI